MATIGSDPSSRSEGRRDDAVAFLINSASASTGHAGDRGGSPRSSVNSQLHDRRSPNEL
jgi:hypothetical protein